MVRPWPPSLPSPEEAGGFGIRAGVRGRPGGTGARSLAAPLRGLPLKERKIKGKTKKNPSVKNPNKRGGRRARREEQNEARFLRRGALTEVAGSAFQHRNLNGERGGQKNNSGSRRKMGPGRRGGAPGKRLGAAGLRPGPRGGRSGGRGAWPRQARGPEREGAADAKAVPGVQAPGPAGRPGSARSAAGTAAAAPGSLGPAGGAFQAGRHRGPVREGASLSVQKEIGLAGLPSGGKKQEQA